MKKVLICVPSLSVVNGISKFIMTYYNSLIENNYIVDFLLVEKNTSYPKYLEELARSESKVYYIPDNSVLNRVDKTRKKMKEIINLNHYDIVHVNLVDLYAYGCIKEARENNIENILYHVHNPYTITKLLFLRDILNYFCIKMSSNLVACTEYAGQSMFHKKNFCVVRNAICFEEYKYNIKWREEHRKSLGLEGKYVVGAVGRIASQKNPLFTLKVFREILKIHENAHLVWIGTGNLKNKMLKYIKQNKLESNVTILDNRKDINELYSAFDIFLLPSKYEGLGIVFLEAQGSGLPVYTSTNVSSDIKKSNLVHLFSLSDSPKKWADKIINDREKYLDRDKYYYILKESDYDFLLNKNTLIDLYEGSDK